MSDVTEAMIEAAWRREEDPVAQLIVIRSDADPAPIAVTDWPGGITSNGVDYPHYPFELVWHGASKEDPFGKGKLTIGNVDRRIEEACDAALTPPEIDLSLVRVDAPDVVERAVLGAKVPNVEGDALQVSAVIKPRDFSDEPACAAKYVPSTVPGMF
ncbi:MAG: hypothetical protein DI531_15405 [Brevundimonas sp.]|uniref:hypothetical protein n=1 Tax=Brevundimonas sp. TaxID=1871086 RepID=UPI000DB41860|nr:hypothetical protein [Brevundimonas sp.]PZU71649.1 MAG: hypothetical protein DI531_15405 [Brevundimonas sp.]